MAYGIRNFNVAFTRALHNPYPELNQSISSYRPLFLYYPNILFHLRLGLPRGLFSVGLPVRSLSSLTFTTLSSLLGPNIRPTVLSTKTLNLSSSLNARVPVSQSISGNIIVLYIL